MVYIVVDVVQHMRNQGPCAVGREGNVFHEARQALALQVLNRHGVEDDVKGVNIQVNLGVEAEARGRARSVERDVEHRDVGRAVVRHEHLQVVVSDDKTARFAEVGDAVLVGVCIGGREGCWDLVEVVQVLQRGDFSQGVGVEELDRARAKAGYREKLAVWGNRKAVGLDTHAAQGCDYGLGGGVDDGDRSTPRPHGDTRCAVLREGNIPALVGHEQSAPAHRQGKRARVHAHHDLGHDRAGAHIDQGHGVVVPVAGPDAVLVARIHGERVDLGVLGRCGEPKKACEEEGGGGSVKHDEKC